MTAEHVPASASDAEVKNHANLIWSVAELLRGDYKQADYGKVVLPLVVMRRLDQMLEPTRDAVITRAAQLEKAGVENPERLLRSAAKHQFFNRHPLRFHQLLNDPAGIGDQLEAYIDGYSVLARQAIDKFDFESHIPRLKDANLLYKVVGRICDVDLHPDRVANADMGAIFEELIRRFSEASNETAGEHYTPREVVRLMVNLLLDGDEDVLTQPGVRRRVFDCACGTGGMLSEAQEQIYRYNPDAEVSLHGQELNPESYAICLGDMLIKGQDASHIVHGNSLSNDGHAGERFHYAIANPPFGVDWSKVEEAVRDEHESLGFDGRFGPGLPRKSDGQLLFLMHLLSKLRTAEAGGGRLAIVHNGSPLFTGAAGSGESEIRRYLMEHDLLEAIVALPEQLFYNTGIASYVWLVTNRKTPERRGLVQLIDARESWTKMRKSLGEKRRYLDDDQIAEVVRLHGALEEGDRVKLVPNEQFGYRTITVDRPLRARWQVDAETWAGVADDKPVAKLGDARDAAVAAVEGMPAGAFSGEAACRAAIRDALVAAGVTKPAPGLLKALTARCLTRDPDLDPIRNKEGAVADPDLRDTENVPLTDDIRDYLDREVLPHVPDAWVTDPQGRVGYEIPFTRLFYRYTPSRPSAEIKSELREREQRIRDLLAEVLV